MRGLSFKGFAVAALVAAVVVPVASAKSGVRVRLSVLPLPASAIGTAAFEAVLPANASAKRQAFSLGSVSCASAGDCSAAGSYLDSSGNTEGLLLTETAGNWGVGVEAVLPGNAASNPHVAINSISCPSAGDCSAVGTYTDNSQSTEGLLLNETNGSWATGIEAHLPANAAAPKLSVESHPPGLAVSCASAGNCSAVGSYVDTSGETEGLLLTETNGSWATGVEATLPADAVASQILDVESVSCPSVGNCSAVGEYYNSEGQQGLLLTETGGVWSPGVKATLPADAAANPGVVIGSISCSSSGDCTAVGGYTGSSYIGGLLLTETGGSWSAGVKASLPSNADTNRQGAVLSSVSCVSAGNCTAVGTYQVSGNQQGLLLSETAGSWATGVEAPLPGNADRTNRPYVVLGNVSCASAGDCVAVGGYNAGTLAFEGLVLTETAGSWDAAEVAPPLNLYASTPWVLPGDVSCAPGGGCSAVGSYVEASTGNYAGLLMGGAPSMVKLQVATHGAGSGLIEGPGIACGSGESSCSKSFNAGERVTLTTMTGRALRNGVFVPSRFVGWSGGSCSGKGSCLVNTALSDQTVTATFDLLRTCVVPNVKGEPLKAAENAIRTRHCAVGKIKRAASHTIKNGRVISQSPRHGKRLKDEAKVSLLVSNGNP